MKRGACEHPKVYDLMARLKKRRPEVLGYLELLWQFAAKFAPQGNIGRFPDDRIEAACDWTGRRGALIDALVQAGWLQLDSSYRILVHDWHEHADNTVRKRLQRDRLTFFQPTETTSRQCPDTVQTPSALKGETLSALCTGEGAGTGMSACVRPGAGPGTGTPLEGNRGLREAERPALASPSAAGPVSTLRSDELEMLRQAEQRNAERRKALEGKQETPHTARGLALAKRIPT